jgi:hypothetical protein
MKINTISLTELNGHQVELGVTKIRADKFGEGQYIIPIFINEMAMLAQADDGNVVPLQTSAPWEPYIEEKHGVGNFQYMSAEEYIEGLKELEKSGDEITMYIMDKLNDLLSFKQYTRVKEILDTINLEDFEDVEQVIVSTLISANPISPLLRAIPKEEDIKELNVARCKFYDMSYDYFVKNHGDERAKNVLSGLKPSNYAKDVEYYDTLYIGGAPKEK